MVTSHTSNSGDAVEQVTIGRHTFPLFSHPLFRVRVSEDAYVQSKVEEKLRDSDLQQAMDAMVEELLRKGCDGATDADVEALLQRRLSDFDAFFFSATDTAPLCSPEGPATPIEDRGDTGTSVGTSTVVGDKMRNAWVSSSFDSPSCQPRNVVPASDLLVGSSFVTSQRQRGTSRVAGGSTVSVVSAASPLHTPKCRHHVPAGASIARSVPAPSTVVCARGDSDTHPFVSMPFLKPRPMRGSNNCTDIVPEKNGCLQPISLSGKPVSIQPTSISSRELLRTSESVTPLAQTASVSRVGFPTLSKATTIARSSSTFTTDTCTSAALAARSRGLAEGKLSQWREAIRLVAYSLLHVRLEVGTREDSKGHGGISWSDMNRRTGPMATQAVDTHRLAHLNSNAFAAMDVLMDGNSCCIRRRQKTMVATPAQCTSMLLTQQQRHEMRQLGSKCVSSTQPISTIKARKVIAVLRRKQSNKAAPGESSGRHERGSRMASPSERSGVKVKNQYGPIQERVSIMECRNAFTPACGEACPEANYCAGGQYISLGRFCVAEPHVSPSMPHRDGRGAAPNRITRLPSGCWGQDGEPDAAHSWVSKAGRVGTVMLTVDGRLPNSTAFQEEQLRSSANPPARTEGFSKALRFIQDAV